MNFLSWTALKSAPFQLVKHLLRTDCKCHGVSGSCAMKTCWKTLPPFRVVGDTLMRKYNKARLVTTPADAPERLIYKRRSARKAQQPPKRLELVYLQPSPNYCDQDVSQGSLGTFGRQCNRNRTATRGGVDSCDLLCCGRGYNTHRINRSYQCRCKFRWCCDVICDECYEHSEQYTCK